MTRCHRWDAHHDAYLAGRLSALAAESFEAHAGDCAHCAVALEEATRLPWAVPSVLPPPTESRQRLLGALASRRSHRPTRGWLAPIAIAAGVVITGLIMTPEQKPAQSGPPTPVAAALARAHAASPLAMLDAAAAELSAALARRPGDPGLEDALARLASQRRSLLTLVEEFES